MELIRSSHTTFLGPNIADKTYKEGYDQLLGNMGYRLWISKARWKRNLLELTWENDGVAPFYGDWKVYLYLENPEGKIVENPQADITLSQILPRRTGEDSHLVRHRKGDKSSEGRLPPVCRNRRSYD